jgi:hypothetical protein
MEVVWSKSDVEKIPTNLEERIPGVEQVRNKPRSNLKIRKC